MSAANVFFADALTLEHDIDRKIGKIGAKAKIGDGPRNADESSIDTGCHDQIGFIQHLANRIGVVNGPALSQCRADQGIDEFGRGQVGFDRAPKGHELALKQNALSFVEVFRMVRNG